MAQSTAHHCQSNGSMITYSSLGGQRKGTAEMCLKALVELVIELIGHSMLKLPGYC